MPDRTLGNLGGGIVEPGNINLYSRPRVVNPDGSISTVRSMSVNIDGQEILIPTVERNGKRILSDDEAIQQYLQSGEHLGIFKTPEAATAYAEALHNQFEQGDYDVPLATSRKSPDIRLLAKALSVRYGK